MSTVKSYAALAAKAPLTPYSIQRRDVGDYDVLIDIKYCGICHSDLHQVGDEWGGATFPMVPGHEIAGVVSKIGSKVSKFKIGEHAGIGCMIDSCRHCENCNDNLEQYCAEGANWTYNSTNRDGSPSQGGYSTQIVVDENYVLHLPTNLALDAAAPLLCAGITLYSPLRHWQAGPGKRVAIVGLGGLGHMGVKLAHAMQADVTVLSHSLKKEDDAKRLGANHFYSTADKTTFEKLATSFDLIICTVSAGIDWNEYIQLLKRDGSMVVVGIPEGSVPIFPFTLVSCRRNLAGSLIGGIKETQDMLDFCGKHNITSDIELIPIQKVNEAYQRVLKSDVRYRFVIDIASLSRG